MSPFYDVLDSFIIGALIVVVMWLVIAYCKSEFYDGDDGDETTY